MGGVRDSAAEGECEHDAALIPSFAAFVFLSGSRQRRRARSAFCMSLACARARLRLLATSRTAAILRVIGTRDGHEQHRGPSVRHCRCDVVGRSQWAHYMTTWGRPRFNLDCPAQRPRFVAGMVPSGDACVAFGLCCGGAIHWRGDALMSCSRPSGARCPRTVPDASALELNSALRCSIGHPSIRPRRAARAPLMCRSRVARSPLRCRSCVAHVPLRSHPHVAHVPLTCHSHAAHAPLATPRTEAHWNDQESGTSTRIQTVPARSSKVAFLRVMESIGGELGDICGNLKLLKSDQSRMAPPLGFPLAGAIAANVGGVESASFLEDAQPLQAIESRQREIERGRERLFSPKTAVEAVVA